MNNQEISASRMPKIENITDLSSAIKKLERKIQLQEADLQEHFHTILVSFKPTNILRSTIHEVQDSPE